MTKADKKLKPAQLTAVDLLALGSSVSAAATAAKVSRQTVSEWLNQDAEFIAALNTRRGELWAEAADRLRALLPRALDVIEKALATEGPDALPAALALVKLVRVNVAPALATDPRAIEAAHAERDRETLHRRLRAGLYDG